MVGAQRLAVAVRDEQRRRAGEVLEPQVGAVAVLRPDQHVRRPSGAGGASSSSVRRRDAGPGVVEHRELRDAVEVGLHLACAAGAPNCGQSQRARSPVGGRAEDREVPGPARRRRAPARSAGPASRAGRTAPAAGGRRRRPRRACAAPSRSKGVVTRSSCCASARTRAGPSAAGVLARGCSVAPCAPSSCASPSGPPGRARVARPPPRAPGTCPGLFCFREHPMVVVMRPGAAPEEVDAVVARVEQAGGSAFVSRGVHRTIVGLVGDVVQFQALNLRAMPGRRRGRPGLQALQARQPRAPPGRLDVTVGERGDVHIGPDTFVLIAGPCAVETAEQTLRGRATWPRPPARRCCAAGRTSRAPPRTPSRGSARRGWRSSPRRASETGLPVVTEVVDPKDVAAGRRVRRHAADRHPQHAELPAAAGGRRGRASR